MVDLNTEQLEATLRDRGVPASPVYGLDRTLTHPLVEEREPLLAPAGDGADDRRLVRLPMIAAGTSVRWPPPLGAHTREVLGAVGLSPDDLNGM